MGKVKSTDDYVEPERTPEDIYSEGFDDGLQAGLSAINEMPIQDLLDIVSARIKQMRGVK